MCLRFAAATAAEAGHDCLHQRPAIGVCTVALAVGLYLSLVEGGGGGIGGGEGRRGEGGKRGKRGERGGWRRGRQGKVRRERGVNKGRIHVCRSTCTRILYVHVHVNVHVHVHVHVLHIMIMIIRSVMTTPNKKHYMKHHNESLLGEECSNIPNHFEMMMLYMYMYIKTNLHKDMYMYMYM